MINDKFLDNLPKLRDSIGIITYEYHQGSAGYPIQREELSNMTGYVTIRRDNPKALG